MTVKTWRCKELLAEARANLTARPAAAAFLMLAALGVCMSSGLTDMSAARSVEHYDTTLVLDGYTTVKVTSARTGGSLSGPVCASFEGQEGVVAAGGVSYPRTAYAASDPGNGFEEMSAVGAIATVLSGRAYPPGREEGFVVSTELASELGVGVGSYLKAGSAIARVTTVAELGQRDELLGRALLVPEGYQGSVAACYVQFAPGDFAQGVAELEGAFGPVRDVTYQVLVPHGGATTTPAAMWAGRASRYVWLFAGLALGVLVAWRVRARRHEGSVYLVTGSSRAQVALLLLLEVQAAVWVGVAGALLWTGFAAEVTRTSGEAFRAGAVAAARTALTALCVVPLGSAWMLRSDLVRALRERAS